MRSGVGENQVRKEEVMTPIVTNLPSTNEEEASVSAAEAAERQQRCPLMRRVWRIVESMCGRENQGFDRDMRALILFFGICCVGGFHLSYPASHTAFSLHAKGVNKRFLKRKLDDIARSTSPQETDHAIQREDGQTDHSSDFLAKARMDGVAEVTSDQSEAEIKAQVDQIVTQQKKMVEVLSAVKSAVKETVFKKGWETEMNEGGGALWVDDLLDEKTRAAVAHAVSLVDVTKEEGVEGGEVDLQTRGYFKNLGRGDYEKAAKAVEFVVVASKAVGEECGHRVRSEVQQNRVGGEFGLAAGGEVELALPEEEGDDRVELELLYVTAGSLVLRVGDAAEARTVSANSLVLIDRAHVGKEGSVVTRVFEKDGEGERAGEVRIDRITIWMYAIRERASE